jgi:hypothetical protein
MSKEKIETLKKELEELSTTTQRSRSTKTERAKTQEKPMREQWEQ